MELLLLIPPISYLHPLQSKVSENKLSGAASFQKLLLYTWHEQYSEKKTKLTEHPSGKLRKVTSDLEVGDKGFSGS